MPDYLKIGSNTLIQHCVSGTLSQNSELRVLPSQSAVRRPPKSCYLMQSYYECVQRLDLGQG